MSDELRYEQPSVDAQTEENQQGVPRRPLPLRGRGYFDIRMILLLGLLSIAYIWLRNYYDKLWRQEQALEIEVKNLRSESITLTAELMFMSKESEVVRHVQARGMELEESKSPPIIIRYQER